MITKDEVEHLINTYYVENAVSEMMGLLAHVQVAAPKVILEIGICFGGTLLIWEKILPEDGILIAIDICPSIEQRITGQEVPMRGRPSPWVVEKRFTLNDITFLKLQSPKDIYVALSDSKSPKVSAAIKQLLGDRKIDFFFHDGIHYGTGPVYDYANFEDLIAVCALVCVGDVSDLTHPEQPIIPNLGTQSLWRAFPEPKIAKVEGHAQGMALWWKTEDFKIDPEKIIAQEGLDDYAPNGPLHVRNK